MVRKLQAQTHMGSYRRFPRKSIVAPATENSIRTVREEALPVRFGPCARLPRAALVAPCPAKPLRWPSVLARRAATAAAQRCPEAASPQCRTCSSCHARCAARGWASCWLSCRPGPRACSTPGGPGGHGILILSSCTEQNPALVWPSPWGGEAHLKALADQRNPSAQRLHQLQNPLPLPRWTWCPDSPDCPFVSRPTGSEALGRCTAYL